MKKSFLFAALLLAAAGSWAFHPQAEGPAGHMMVISNVSLGFDAQAAIVTIAPDGTQQEQAVDFRRGNARRVAANMTEVHKAALAALNRYAREGWHVVSTSPSGLTNGEGTFFTQTVYVLEKR